MRSSQLGRLNEHSTVCYVDWHSGAKLKRNRSKLPISSERPLLSVDGSSEAKNGKFFRLGFYFYSNIHVEPMNRKVLRLDEIVMPPWLRTVPSVLRAGNVKNRLAIPGL